MRFRRWVIGLIIGVLAGATLSAVNGKAQGQQSRPEVLVRYMEGESWQLRYVKSDGTALDLLQDAPPFTYPNFLMLSPDRQWLYFTATFPEDLQGKLMELEGYPRRVYRVPTTGGVPEVIMDTPSGGGDFYRFREGWSNLVVPTPDGEYIVYHPRDATAEGWRGLWRVRSDGTDNLEISAGLTGRSVRSYDWVVSDDGQWVYFGVDRLDLPTAIYRARIDGTTPPEIVTEVSPQTIWRIRGNWLFASTPDETVVSLEDGTSRRMFEAGQYRGVVLEQAFPNQDIAIWKVIAEDGTDYLEAMRISDGTSLWKVKARLLAVLGDEWLVLNIHTPGRANDLIRMRLDSGEQTMIAEAWQGWPEIRLAAGEWLVLDLGSDIDYSLWGIHAMTGEQRIFWANPNPENYSPFAQAISSDGTWLAYSISSNETSSTSLQMMSLADDAGAPIELIRTSEGMYRSLDVWFLE